MAKKTSKSAARKILDQFAALPARERMLALVAFLGFAYLVCDLAWYRPQVAQAKALQAQVDQLNAEADGLSRAIQLVSAETPAGATAAQKAERDKLAAEVEKAETLVRQAQGTMKVGEMIRTLAAQSAGVTVVSLRTLPSTLFFNAATAQAAAAAAAGAASGAAQPKPAASAPAQASAASLPNIYRHGVEVTLRGSYPALVGYLQALERGASGLYWGALRMETTTYPETSVRATLYMLNVQPELSFD